MAGINAVSKDFMKGSLLTFAVLIFAVTCSAQYTYRLDVKSPELEGKQIKLYLLENNMQSAWRTDSAVCINGIARFSGSMTQPVHFVDLGYKSKGKSLSVRLPLDSGRHAVNVYVDKTANGELKASGLETNSMKIRLESMKIWDAVYRKHLLGTKGRSLSKEAFREEMQGQLQLVSMHPNDYFSLLSLYQIGASEVSLSHAKAVLETWAKLDTKLGESPLGKLVYDRQKNFTKGYLAAQVGKEITDFTVSDVDGNTFNSQNLKGKNYLIVLSATWCLPCQKQLPLLKTLYQKYKAAGLQVVYFNNDSDVVRWKNHVEKNKLTWINVSERLRFSESKIPKYFGVYSIPTCILVDDKGKITYNSDQDDTGLQKLDNAIKQII